MLVPSSATRKLLEARLQAYTEQFEESPEALTYWEEVRGLTRATAAEFLVGFVAPGRALKGDQRFEGRLAIPYITANGLPVGFKFRSIDGSQDRYSKDKGEPNRLYNTRVLKRARKVVICEGEVDTLSASQAGLQAVGVPGASNWKAEWGRVFYNREVTVLADGDDAGHDFAEMVATKLHGVRIIDLPAGEDVNSMLVKKGNGYIRDLVVG